jgi:hypothetical protein
MSMTKRHYEICVYPSREGTTAQQLDQEFAHGRKEVGPALNRMKQLHPKAFIFVRQYSKRGSFRVLHKLTYDGSKLEPVCQTLKQ